MIKFRNKNVLVYGMSSSGEWATKLLIKLHANIFMFDNNYSKLVSNGKKNCFVVQYLNEDLIKEFDYIIVSPSIEYDNENLVIARRLGKKVFSEVEFAGQFSKNFVAITGTNGKTTTTQLVTAILQKKYKAIACGNIGYPLSRAVLQNKRAIKVVEVSSFMLENADTFSPHVATITNIEADHLIRHHDMETYIKLKLSIFKNLTANDYAVVNLDLPFKPGVNAKILTYSLNKIADVYFKGGYIYLHGEKIIAENELKLKGKHNLYNVMCAICFGYIYKVKPADIRRALLDFKPEKYRIERVGTHNGINFYNDSKSTNIASTLACVDTINSPILLLLGGSKKDLDYTELFKKLPKRVREIGVYGEIADDLVVANNEKFKMNKFETLTEAFNYLSSMAKKNDNIVLSPASASYDQYKSYVERAKEFNDLVEKYAEKENR